LDSAAQNFLVNDKLTRIYPEIPDSNSTFLSKPITIYNSIKNLKKQNNVYSKNSNNNLNNLYDLEGINIFEDRIYSGDDTFTNNDYYKILDNSNNW
jgi:hypothetical protein